MSVNCLSDLDNIYCFALLYFFHFLLPFLHLLIFLCNSAIFLFLNLFTLLALRPVTIIALPFSQYELIVCISPTSIPAMFLLLFMLIPAMFLLLFMLSINPSSYANDNFNPLSYINSISFILPIGNSLTYTTICCCLFPFHIPILNSILPLSYILKPSLAHLVL